MGDLRPPERARSAHLRYIDFLENVAHGRIAFTPPGFADQTNAIEGVPLDLNLDALVDGPMANSLILTGISTALVVIASVPIAMYEASRRRERGAHIASIIAVALSSTPPSLLGTLLIVGLSSDLHLLNLNAPDWNNGDVLAHPAALVLPVLTCPSARSSSSAATCGYPPWRSRPRTTSRPRVPRARRAHA